MVSGEFISMAIKSQKAKHVKWDVPIMLVGNEYPQWDNSGGAMKRRALPFLFAEPVSLLHNNTQLDKAMELERPAALRKALWAYRTLIKRVGTEPLDRHLPPCFVANSNELAESTNSIEAFLYTNLIVSKCSHHTTFMPRSVFEAHYRAWAHRTDKRVRQVTTTGCRSIWPEFNIKEIKIENDLTYNGETFRVGEVFLLGVDLPERIGQSALPVEGSNPHEVNDPYARGGNARGRKRSSPSASFRSTEDDQPDYHRDDPNSPSFKRARQNQGHGNESSARTPMSSRKRARGPRETGETEAEIQANKRRAAESTIPPPLKSKSTLPRRSKDHVAPHEGALHADFEPSDFVSSSGFNF